MYRPNQVIRYKYKFVSGFKLFQVQGWRHILDLILNDAHNQELAVLELPIVEVSDALPGLRTE